MLEVLKLFLDVADAPVIEVHFPARASAARLCLRDRLAASRSRTRSSSSSASRGRPGRAGGGEPATSRSPTEDGGGEAGRQGRKKDEAADAGHRTADGRRRRRRFSRTRRGSPDEDQGRRADARLPGLLPDPAHARDDLHSADDFARVRDRRTPATTSTAATSSCSASRLARLHRVLRRLGHQLGGPADPREPERDARDRRPRVPASSTTATACGWSAGSTDEGLLLGQQHAAPDARARARCSRSRSRCESSARAPAGEPISGRASRSA